MAEAKRKVGRPRIRPELEGAREYVGLGVSKHLKDKLKEAAYKANRSLSAEIHDRLEKSFDREWLLSEVKRAVTSANR